MERLDLSWFSGEPSWLNDRQKRAQLSLAAQEGVFMAALLVRSELSVAKLACELERIGWEGVKRTPLDWADLVDHADDVERARAELGEFQQFAFGAPKRKPVRWYPVKIYRRLVRARSEIASLHDRKRRTCDCGLNHALPASGQRQGRPAKSFDNACRQRRYRRRRKHGTKPNWRMARNRR